MTDIVAFLTARLDEDERWAHEASLLNEESGYVAGGIHWQWTDAYGNQLQLDPLTMEYADDEIPSGELLLESVETYLTRSVGELSQLTIQGAYQVPVAAAVHIARHGPARVLRDVAAKRVVLQLHQITAVPEKWGDVRHHPDQGKLPGKPRVNHVGELTGGTVYRCAICDLVSAGIRDDPEHGYTVRELPGCETLLALAAAYDEHPDYDPVWRVK